MRGWRWDLGGTSLFPVGKTGEPQPILGGFNHEWLRYRCALEVRFDSSSPLAGLGRLIAGGSAIKRARLRAYPNNPRLPRPAARPAGERQPYKAGLFG